MVSSRLMYRSLGDGVSEAEHNIRRVVWPDPRHPLVTLSRWCSALKLHQKHELGRNIFFGKWFCSFCLFWFCYWIVLSLALFKKRLFVSE